MYRVIKGYVTIHEKGNESKSTCSRCVGGPCRLPAPSPCSVGGAVGGGGGMAGRVLPGDFEQGRGDLWQASRELKWRVFLASKFGGFKSRVNPAGCHGRFFWRVISAGYFGGSFWRVILAGHFGAFIWRVFMAKEKSGFLKKRKAKEKEEKCILSRPVNCIMIIVCSQ
jgi:hypothetical protein